MLTCLELLSEENVNASKWALINYLGENISHQPGATLTNTSSAPLGVASVLGTLGD